MRRTLALLVALALLPGCEPPKQEGRAQQSVMTMSAGKTHRITREMQKTWKAPGNGPGACVWEKRWKDSDKVERGKTLTVTFTDQIYDFTSSKGCGTWRTKRRRRHDLRVAARLARPVGAARAVRARVPRQGAVLARAAGVAGLMKHRRERDRDPLWDDDFYPPRVNPWLALSVLAATALLIVLMVVT